MKGVKQQVCRKLPVIDIRECGRMKLKAHKFRSQVLEHLVKECAQQKAGSHGNLRET